MAIRITMRDDGPYVIQPGDAERVALVDHRGNAIRRPDGCVTLCRCGASSTRPFCDGTHARIGFRAAAPAGAQLDPQGG